MDFLLISLVLFAIAALGGLVLAGMHFKGRPRPWPLSIVHLLLGAAGLVFLIVAIVAGDAGALATIALVLFVLVALGGFTLMAYHAKKNPLPTPLVLVHGAGAAVGFILLLAEVLRAPGP